MKFLKLTSLILLVVLVAASATAKTAQWSLPPKYEKLSRYYADIYVFESDGKWGLVKPDNIEVLPPSYDFVTPFVNGYSLAGNKEGSKNRLMCIIDDGGNVSEVKSVYYLSASCPYFSEGKLAVADRSGKYGFISVSGQPVVKCQFDNVLPFRGGWAPVKQGNYMKYIRDSYDANPSRNILPVDFHYGEMTAASCFLNDKAVIAYNDDYAQIDNAGNKIRKLKEYEFKDLFKRSNSAPKTDNAFSDASSNLSYSENGLWGLKDGDYVILYPQFDNVAKQFSDGYILVTKDGKTGLLKLSSENIDIALNTPSGSGNLLEADRNGNIGRVNLNISIPANASNLKVYADLGDGQATDITSAINISGNKATADLLPKVTKNAENFSINLTVENDGLLVAKTSQDFRISYPIILRVTPPGPGFIQADANDNASFHSTIYNDSSKAVTVTATWSTGGNTTVEIPPHGSKTISSSKKVTADHTQNVTVTLSTGEKNSNNISFKTYF